MKQPLFEIKDVDRRFYEEHLRGFLPERIIDVHTHVWLHEFKAKRDASRLVSWPSLVAKDNPIEDLLETYRLMFPGKEVMPVIFGTVTSRQDDIEGANRYIRESSKKCRVASLLYSTPEWSGEELERRLAEGGFLGVKCYLSLSAPELKPDDITIFDFLPKKHLAVLNRLGMMVILHVPRSGRIKDPMNVAQIVEIDREFSNVKLVLAHAGRAYCPEDVGTAYDQIAKTRAMFDISANTSALNFERLIRAVGPGRILFGSDLPILRMRMRRICENGIYVNLVPRGLYGDVSDDKNMREIDGEDAARLTFFMYEEIMAFKEAAGRTGLTKVETDAVFFGNADRLLQGCRPTGR